MLALKINTTKTFMHKLLIGDAFHVFSLVEASITTFNQFHIDGKLHMDFFDTDTEQQLSADKIIYSSWGDVKAYCYSIIRGKLPPLQFKFIMRLSPSQINILPANNIFSFSDSELSDLFLNIQFKNNDLYIPVAELIPYKVIYFLNRNTKLKFVHIVRHVFCKRIRSR